MWWDPFDCSYAPKQNARADDKRYYAAFTLRRYMSFIIFIFSVAILNDCEISGVCFSLVIPAIGINMQMAKKGEHDHIKYIKNVYYALREGVK